MSPRNRQLLTWMPRVLGALYAVFISVFAFDVWSMEGSNWAKMGGFLIHLLPTYLVVAALLAGWVRPAYGGVGFLLLAAIFSLFFGWRELGLWLLMGGSLVLIGLLFLADWRVSQARLRPRY